MRRPKFPSKAWTEKSLLVLQQTLAQHVGDAPLPIDMMRPYGCGSWGCVYPTNYKGIVLKITEDESEAHFAKYILDVAQKTGWMSSGLKITHAVARTWLEDRAVFAIWMENVSVIGDDAFDRARKIFGKADAEAVEDLLDRYDHISEGFVSRYYYKANPKFVRKQLLALQNIGIDVEMDPGYVRRVLRFLNKERKRSLSRAVALGILASAAETEVIARHQSGKLLAQALGGYFSRGVLLSDMHMDNVGLAVRPGYPRGTLVITDYGGAVFFGFDPSKINITPIERFRAELWYDPRVNVSLAG